MQPCQVTVASVGCESTGLLHASALQRGIDRRKIPGYLWDIDAVKGSLEHLKQMVSAGTLVTMAPGGPIDELFDRHAAVHCGCVHKHHAAQFRSTGRDSLSTWRYFSDVDVHTADAVVLDTPGLGLLDFEI